METRELTCINCPMGCRISVVMERDDIISVTGNTCKRGFVYACNEVRSPVRTVTTTIKVTGGVADRVSCKTKEPVPKDKILDFRGHGSNKSGFLQGSRGYRRRPY